MHKRTIKLANFEALQRVARFRSSKNVVWLVFRVVLLLSLIMVMAGAHLTYTKNIADVSVVFAFDTSSTMLSTDVPPTRFDAGKQALLRMLDEFENENRPYNIGIVSFSGVSFVEARLTTDLSKVRSAVEDISLGAVAGTALGDAVISSTNLLVDEPENRARVVVLITDGRNTVGPSVEDAVTFANTNFVSIYSLGVGTVEGALIYNISYPTRLDIEDLQYASNATGGAFYPVSDVSQMSAALGAIFEPGTGLKAYTDLTPFFTFAIFALLLFEWLLVNTKFNIAHF